MMPSYMDGAALVSGGTGGIGAAVVGLLARAGVPVAFTYHRRREAAEDLARELGGAARARAYPWSGPDFAAASRLVSRVAEDLGPIRFFVAAAGTSQETAFHRLEQAEAEHLVAGNLTSVIALARAVITPMLKAGGGRIVLVGSVSGQRGLKGHTVYAATKAGLEGFTRSLAQEAGAFGVTVNCVAPGFIDTPMLGAASPETRKAWIRRIPLGRLGRPEEVAALIGYVLSEQASYLTGQTLTLDGGVSL